MSYYFDIKELKRSMNDSRKYSHRFERTYTVKLGKLKELCGKLPEENEAFFIETKKSFTAFTFIVYLIQHTGYINRLYIATYSTNERIINALIRWKEAGKIGTIHLHISETLKFRMPKVYQRLLQLQQEGVLSITLAWTHKKITCMDTPAGEFIVEGSGNYGENAMQEQYIFLKSKQVYDFRIGNS
ncbi:MAG: hypothetical protein H6Q12_42 [Bacteroidetes bacterium]|nr:hypothetical protein [Bacteroidota bacterium]